MPKPLSPEQVEALQASGALPPLEALASEASERPEPGAVFRVLGNTGLPHMEQTGRMEITSSVFGDRFEKVHIATSNLLSLVGERIPQPGDDPSLLEQARQAETTFALYEQIGLKPNIVITPAHRPLAFWKELFLATQNSPLNPDQVDKKLLRNGGLWVANCVQAEWEQLVSIGAPDVTDSGFKVEVVSGTAKPKIVNVTPYGYKDANNEQPHPKLNDLLTKLGFPTVTDRSNQATPSNPTPPLIQPNCLPQIDTYAMLQLTRIAQGKKLIDQITGSSLKGKLQNGFLPSGCWSPDDGQVLLDWGGFGRLDDYTGVRPSGRGKRG